MKGLAVGLLLVLGQTGFIAASDGITKYLSCQFEAPQLFVLSSGMILAAMLARGRTGRKALRTRSPRVMGLRAGLTVVASFAFFQAFHMLPLADVFLFIAMIPLISAALSGPFLNETPRPTAWIALMIGTVGLLAMSPGGLTGFQGGHAWAALAALCGSGSLLAGRYIGRIEKAPMAQVFWPNLALLVAMGAALPFVWQPMDVADLFWIAAYSAALFAARYLVAEALRLLPAHLVTPLMNLQFLWMVAIGWLAFAEIPATGTVVGVTLITASGLWLVFEEHRARLAEARAWGLSRVSETTNVRTGLARAFVLDLAVRKKPGTPGPFVTSRKRHRSRRNLQHWGFRSRSARRSALR